jgi:hypothetical protein
MRIFIGGATQVQVTDEYGKLMYEIGLGAGVHPPEGQEPSPIPPPDGGNSPLPPGGVIPPAPISGGEIPWPASGQVVYKVPMQQLQTVRYTMKWASKMDPSKTGFVRVVEAPGSAVMHRHLKLYVNQVLKFDSTPFNDTGPSANLCNAPTPGNLSTVMMSAGDILGIEVTNGENTTAQPSDMWLDIATPDRY